MTEDIYFWCYRRAVCCSSNKTITDTFLRAADLIIALDAKSHRRLIPRPSTCPKIFDGHCNLSMTMRTIVNVGRAMFTFCCLRVNRLKTFGALGITLWFFHGSCLGLLKPKSYTLDSAIQLKLLSKCFHESAPKLEQQLETGNDEKPRPRGG